MEENSASVLKRLAWWIYKRKVDHRESYHLFLTRLPTESLIDFAPLARLVHEGYFSVIVTLNDPTPLQKMFQAQDVESSQYHVLTVGLNEEEEIVDALYGQAPGICFIQLPTNPVEQSALSSKLLKHLQNYFSHDVIIVGPVKQEEVYLYSLSVGTAGAVFYIVPSEPAFDDYVIGLMHQQHQVPKEFLITNGLGTSIVFFKELEVLLHEHRKREEADKLLSSSLPSSSPSAKQNAIPAISERSGNRQENRPVSIAVRGGPALFPLKNSIPARVVNSASLKTDVLLVTVTHTETMGVFSQVLNKEQVSLRGRIYYDLGFIGSARTFLVQSTGMGPVGVSPCLEEGIAALNPEILLMVGIAFGCKPQEQALGDVLISQQIAGYDLQKVSTGPGNTRQIRHRGSRSEPGERLFSHFMAGKHGWVSPPAIHFGVIVSGAKVVNHGGLRNELLRFAPDAIGGEMEGITLEKVATRKRKEWMLVKGICDWADGSKDDKYQQIAAENAARFVLQVMQHDEFVLRG